MKIFDGSSPASGTHLPLPRLFKMVSACRCNWLLFLWPKSFKNILKEQRRFCQNNYLWNFIWTLRLLLLCGCLSHQFLIKDTSGSRGPQSGYSFVRNLSLQPASSPGLSRCQEERPRTPTLPKRQDRRQSNSTTCADIKHYCILTFHMYCNSAFLQKPAKKPEKGSLSFALSED